MTVRKSLEKLWREFLWEGVDERKGAHLVNWEVVTKPVDFGGLKIGNLSSRNETLLDKWLWQFHHEAKSL